jgi:mannose-1-phosphate guanylyltransferase
MHEEKGARCTLALIGVEDPSAYGLVRRHEDGAVREFLEKPSPDQIDTNLISAGAYVMERDVLSLIPPDTNFSIERDVFPRLVGEGLYGFAGEGYWLDIGTPERYLQATFDILERNVRTEVGERLGDAFLDLADDVSDAGRVVPPAVVGRGVSIAEGARVGSLAVLAPGVSVGARTTIEQAVVLQGAEVGADCQLRHCIVGAGASIGDGTHVEGGAVLGEGVSIGAGNVITAGARIFPGVSLPDGAIAF